MNVVLKGFLQGSIPVVAFVGGAHHLTKKFKASKPVLYYGSLLAGLGLAYAVVEGKIKAPFMNAEEMFVDCYYCGRNIDLYDETNDSISCDECGKVACGSYKCNYSKNPKETWEDFTCGECVKGMNAEGESWDGTTGDDFRKYDDMELTDKDHEIILEEIERGFENYPADTIRNAKASAVSQINWFGIDKSLGEYDDDEEDIAEE